MRGNRGERQYDVMGIIKSISKAVMEDIQSFIYEAERTRPQRRKDPKAEFITGYTPAKAVVAALIRSIVSRDSSDAVAKWYTEHSSIV